MAGCYPELTKRKNKRACFPRHGKQGTLNFRPKAKDKADYFNTYFMQKGMKRTLASGIALAAAAAIFTVSVKGSSLESLRANAQDTDLGGTKCVETTNCDCKSPSTGTIYNGYKLKNIGESLEVQ